MSHIRILNLTSFVLMALAFFIAAGKLDKSRELNRQLETYCGEQASQERISIERLNRAMELVRGK